MIRAYFFAMAILANAPAYADRPLPEIIETPTPMAAPPAEQPALDLSDVVNADADVADVSQPVVRPPRAYQAVYNAKISIARGEAVMSLGRSEDNQFVLSSTSRARGAARLFRSKPIRECSVFETTESGRWQAKRYRYSDGKKDGAIDFNWATASAVASHDGGEATIALEQGVTDRLLEQLIMSRKIVDQQQLLPAQVIDRAARNTIIYERLGNERITVPAGSFDTISYRRAREGSKRSSIIWFAPTLDGLPVRIEQYRLDDRQAVAELKAYTDEETLQARGTVTPVCP